MKINLTIRFPKAVILILCLCLISGCISNPESHEKIERIVVFGDSNVDTGNLARLFGGTVPRGNTWQGRNSNGPVITEYLAENLNAELLTYAVSGATTGDSNIVSLLAPQLGSIANTGSLKQIEDFMGDGKTLGRGDLVILWAGSNDIFRADRTKSEELEQRINYAIRNINAAIDQLSAVGANQIVVGLRTPRPQLTSDDDLNGQDLNRMLAKSIQERQTDSIGQVMIFDAYSAIKDMIERPDVYGFSNVLDLCVENPKCLSEKYQDGLNIANKYINWDAAHKTTHVHSLMALELQKLLRN